MCVCVYVDELLSVQKETHKWWSGEAGEVQWRVFKAAIVMHVCEKNTGKPSSFV